MRFYSFISKKRIESTMSFIKYSAQRKVVPLDLILGDAQLTKRFEKCKDYFLYHGGNIVIESKTITTTTITTTTTKMTIYFDERLTNDTFDTNPPNTFDEKVQRYRNVFVYYMDAKKDKYLIYLK